MKVDTIAVHKSLISNVAAALWLLVCAGVSFADDQVVSETSVASDDNYWLYTVRDGDTIRGVSLKYLRGYQAYKTLMSVNGLTADQPLTRGQTLKFPIELMLSGPATVRVAAAEGISWQERGTDRTRLTTDSVLYLGDTVVTDDGSVVLEFANGSRVSVEPQSRLSFDVLTKWRDTGMVDTRIRLLKGRLQNTINPLKGPVSKFEVTTPSAVATVRGTWFRVRVDDTGETIFNEVSEGQVNVKNTDGVQPVPQGFGIIAEANKPIEPPVELLPSPEYRVAPDKVTGYPAQFAWRAIPGATGYRVEIYRGDELNVLTEATSTSEAELALPKLESDDYKIRVRGIDSDGLEGLDSDHEFTLLNLPPPPRLVTIPSAVLLTGINNQISWNLEPDARAYRLQVARDRDFSNLVVDEELEGNRFTLGEQVLPRNYYWRVASINHLGQGRFSNERHFGLTKAKKPALKAPRGSYQTGETVKLFWEAIEVAQRYDIEIARDAGFADMITTLQSKEARVRYQFAQAGTYYVRVSPASEFYDGYFSEVLKLEVSGKTEKGVIQKWLGNNN